MQTEILTNVFNNELDEIAPIETMVLSRPPAPWINIDMKKAIEERDKMQMLSKLDRSNNSLRDIYKQKKREVTNSIHRAQYTYCKDELKKCGRYCGKKWKF